MRQDRLLNLQNQIVIVAVLEARLISAARKSHGFLDLRDDN